MARIPHFRFEEDVVHKVVKSFLQKEFNLSKVYGEVSIPCGNLTPKGMRLDILGVAADFSVLAECKISSWPSNIGTAVGTILIQKELLLKKRDEIKEKYDISFKEPLHLFLSFCDFEQKNSDGQKIPENKYLAFGKDHIELFKAITKNLEKQKIGLLIVKSKVAKNYKELTEQDLYVEKII